MTSVYSHVPAREASYPCIGSRTWHAGRRGGRAEKDASTALEDEEDEEARTREEDANTRERGRSSQTGIEHALVYWYRASRSGAFGYSKPATLLVESIRF